TVTNTPTVTPTPTHTSGPGPLLWINPPTSTVTGIGATRTIIVTTSNITDVFGIEITMSYSPTILTVIDANTAMVGTQVIPGPCPQASFVVTNAVSLVNGIIEYRVSQTLPTPPCNGGIVLYVVFECVGLGTSPLSVDDVLIAAIDYEIEHTVQDGVITCQP
ncbi:MAG: hypothetical protein HUU38_14875, partial [Anaerolineales bacterium]|nr:hypothetical protein [Anaerolineales bacterium]